MVIDFYSNCYRATCCSFILEDEKGRTIRRTELLYFLYYGNSITLHRSWLHGYILIIGLFVYVFYSNFYDWGCLFGNWLIPQKYLEEKLKPTKNSHPKFPNSLLHSTVQTQFTAIQRTFQINIKENLISV